MKLHSISLVVILVAAIAIGAVSHFTKPNNVVEETVETFLENHLESKLNLSDDALKGQIDLTPFHPEDGGDFSWDFWFNDDVDER